VLYCVALYTVRWRTRCTGVDDDETRCSEFVSLIAQLPETHRDTLQLLLTHLQRSVCLVMELYIDSIDR